MIYAKSTGILFVECPENGSVPKSYQEFGILISRGNLGINFWEYAIINKCEQSGYQDNPGINTYDQPTYSPPWDNSELNVWPQQVRGPKVYRWLFASMLTSFCQNEIPTLQLLPTKQWNSSSGLLESDLKKKRGTETNISRYLCSKTSFLNVKRKSLFCKIK